MSKRQLLIAACLVAGGIMGHAHAQSSIQKDVEELDRAHQADEDGRWAVPEKPRPGLVQQTPVHPTRQLFQCLGADPWQKVYSAKDLNSKVLGVTQPQVAVTGAPDNGFVAVLYYNGRLGYLPAAPIHPFRQPNVPGTTCTFIGKDDEGKPGRWCMDIPWVVTGTDGWRA